MILGGFLKLNTPTSFESESYTFSKFELKRVASTFDLTVRVRAGEVIFHRPSRSNGLGDKLK